MAPRKAASYLGALIEAGIIGNGEILRYKLKNGTLQAVARARVDGVYLHNNSGEPTSLTGFEREAGSTYHRPANNTYVTSGETLADATERLRNIGLIRASAACPTTLPRRPPAELLDDENDEFCYKCGLEGDLMCCESCPATFHAVCMGLAAPPEGDWHCPACRCHGCGQGSFSGDAPLGTTSVLPVLCNAYATPPCAPQLHIALHPQLNRQHPQQLGHGVSVHTCTSFPAEQQQAVSAQAAQARPHGLPLLAAPANGAKPLELEAAAAAPSGGVAAASTGPDMLKTLKGDEGDGAEVVARGGHVEQPQRLADFGALDAALSAKQGAAGGCVGGVGSKGSPPVAPTLRDFSATAEVRCAASGQRYHCSCLSVKEDGPGGSVAGSRELWFSNLAAEQQSQSLALLCSAGAVPLGVLGDGTQLSFQLIRGAAAAGTACAGYMPAYTKQQRAGLRKALSAALLVLRSCYGPISDSRTGADMMPWLLRGARLGGGVAIDFSGSHAALLFADGSVVGVACLRALGEGLAEVPLLAIRPEVRANGLGQLLLTAVERSLFNCGVRTLVTSAFLAPGQPYTSLLAPGQQGSPPAQGRWGYQLATPEQVDSVVRQAALRLPGLLLATKRLSEASLLPPQPLPDRLRWCTAASSAALQLDGCLSVKGASRAEDAPEPAHTAAEVAHVHRQRQPGSAPKRRREAAADVDSPRKQRAVGAPSAMVSQQAAAPPAPFPLQVQPPPPSLERPAKPGQLWPGGGGLAAAAEESPLVGILRLARLQRQRQAAEEAHQQQLAEQIPFQHEQVHAAQQRVAEGMHQAQRAMEQRRGQQQEWSRPARQLPMPVPQGPRDLPELQEEIRNKQSCLAHKLLAWSNERSA